VDDHETLLTVRQVAEFLQLHRMTIYEYIHAGKIPASKIGKSFRVKEGDLLAFLEATRLGRPKPQTPGKPWRPVRSREGRSTEQVVPLERRTQRTAPPSSDLRAATMLDPVIRGIR